MVEEAVRAFKHVSFERIHYEIRARLSERSTRRAFYLLRNDGEKALSVVPLAAQHWESGRNFKRVEDHAGHSIAFLGSRVILTSMAEAAARGYSAARTDLSLVENSDTEQAIRKAVSTPLEDRYAAGERDEEWLDTINLAMRGIADVYGVSDMEALPEEEVPGGLRLAFDLVSLASGDYYMPLVLLRDPLEPSSKGDAAAGARQFIVHSCPPPRPDAGVDPGPRLADLLKRAHTRQVSFPVTPRSSSTHFAFRAPDGFEQAEMAEL